MADDRFKEDQSAAWAAIEEIANDANLTRANRLEQIRVFAAKQRGVAVGPQPTTVLPPQPASPVDRTMPDIGAAKQREGTGSGPKEDEPH
jgi:hypothetical protein